MLPYSTDLNMALAAGYLIALPGLGAAGVKLTARAECYVKPLYGQQTTAPTAPTVTPAPAAGAEAPGWKHLLSTDPETHIGGEDSPDAPLITHLLVWGTAAGKLEIYAY